MKKFTKHILTLALPLLALTSAQAQDKPALPDGWVELSPDFYTYTAGADDKFGADAVKGEATTADWMVDNVSAGNGSIIAGTSTVSESIIMDLSQYSKIMVMVAPTDASASLSDIGIRFLFNRLIPNGGAGDGNLVDRTISTDENGIAICDISDLPFAHLNAIKVGWGGPEVNVYYIAAQAKSGQPEPQPVVKPELPDGWTELSPDFYTYTAGADDKFGADAVKGDATTADWMVDKVSAGNGSIIAGTGSVSENIIMDLSQYGKIMVMVAPTDASASLSGIGIRFLFNRLIPNGGAGDGNLVDRTVQTDENGMAVCDISDLEFAHLNAIKVGWGGPAVNVYYIAAQAKGDEPVVVKPEIPEGYVELTNQFQKWDGDGASALPIDQAYVDWVFNKELGGGAMVVGTSTVSADVYMDLSEYDELLLTCTPAEQVAAETRAEGYSGMQFRFLFNRVIQDDGQGPLVERNPEASEYGYARCDISDLDFVHLNAIKTGWTSKPGTVYAIAALPKGGTVGIKEVKAAQDNEAIYDLQGRRVAQPAKGIYVKNGKKVLY